MTQASRVEVVHNAVIGVFGLWIADLFLLAGTWWRRHGERSGVQ